MRKLNDESRNFRMVKRYTDLLFAVYPNTVLIRTSTTKERYTPRLDLKILLEEIPSRFKIGTYVEESRRME